MKISAIIITRNEESVISRCLNSVKFCDEVIVVDDYSTDKTTVLAEKFGAKVYQRELQGDFAAQRNFGLEKAMGEWILFVDADETVTEEFKNEILVVLNASAYNAYYIKRRELFWGRELRFGEIQKLREKGLIRLVKKGSGLWKGKVHEEFQSSRPTGTLQNYLIHQPHESINTFLREINFYSTLRAKELYANGYKASLFSLIFFPFFKFVFTFFLKKGFLDGEAGFVYSFLMSFHSFLVRAKLYQYTTITMKLNQ